MNENESNERFELLNESSQALREPRFRKIVVMTIAMLDHVSMIDRFEEFINSVIFITKDDLTLSKFSIPEDVSTYQPGIHIHWFNIDELGDDTIINDWVFKSHFFGDDFHIQLYIFIKSFNILKSSLDVNSMNYSLFDSLLKFSDFIHYSQKEALAQFIDKLPLE